MQSAKNKSDKDVEMCRINRLEMSHLCLPTDVASKNLSLDEDSHLLSSSTQ